MDAGLTLCAILPRYERHLLAMRYARATACHYLHEARAFAEFSWHRQLIWPDTIRARDLEFWQKTLIDSGRQSLFTVVTRMRSLRAFFSYLTEANVIDHDPFLGFPLPRLPNRLPRDVLTVKEAFRLLLSPAVDSVLGRRDQIIIELLYVTGLRVSELCHLNVEDVNLASRVIYVRGGKGGKDRVVPMGQRTAARIKSYLCEPAPGRLSLETGNHPVFLSILGRRLASGAVQSLLRQETTKCGIRKHVTPHTMRHTCATHMHSGGADIMHIKQILGHADVTTTQIYTRIAPRETGQTHRDKHPRERYTRRLSRQNLPLPLATFDPPSVSAIATAPKFCPLAKQRAPSKGETAYGDIGGNLHPQTRHWLQEYKEHLELLNRDGRTIRTHVARLQFFFAFTSAHGVLSCLDVDRQTLVAYREYLRDHMERRKPSNNATVQNQFMAVVLSFYRFLTYREAFRINPATGIRHARKPSPLPKRVPSPAAIARILEQPDLGTPMGLRDRAILEILYSCGLRKSELISLTIDALDLDASRVAVWGGKGEKDRVVPIGKMAVSLLRQYLALARPGLVGPSSPSNVVFLSMRGRRLSKNTLFCLVEKYARNASMGDSGITPHIFRHAFATHLIQNGARLRHVQEMLGHAQISSTQIYVHLTIPDLKRVHRKTHPLG